MSHRNDFVLWLTGLPCSGKTTLSDAVKLRLEMRGLSVEQLDGDCMRKKYGNSLGYTKKDRMTNIRHIVSEAQSQQQRGLVTLVSVISPYRSMREYARERIDDFVEVFLQCPLAVCEARDVKGMYRLARAGKIKHFTGVSDPYEEPLWPELVLNTHRLNIERCAEKLIVYLEKKGLLAGRWELARMESALLK